MRRCRRQPTSTPSADSSSQAASGSGITASVLIACDQSVPDPDSRLHQEIHRVALRIEHATDAAPGQRIHQVDLALDAAAFVGCDTFHAGRQDDRQVFHSAESDR